MDLDLVSRLHNGELHHILKQIFLPLSPDQLAACRSDTPSIGTLKNKQKCKNTICLYSAFATVVPKMVIFDTKLPFFHKLFKIHL